MRTVNRKNFTRYEIRDEWPCTVCGVVKAWTNYNPGQRRCRPCQTLKDKDRYAEKRAKAKDRLETALTKSRELVSRIRAEQAE